MPSHLRPRLPGYRAEPTTKLILTDTFSLMDDKFNTAAGWVLFAGIIALGTSIGSSMYFKADDPESPEQPGYFIDAPEEGTGEPGEMSIAEALTLVTAEDGEKVFAKCTACHTINQGGPNGIGPNLWGTMGAPVGAHAAGFAYSSALSGKGGTWDWANMSEWLKSPRGFAPGTKMSFAGLSKVEDRAAVMLYMNQNGSPLPLPEFTPEDPAAADGEEGAAEGQGSVEGGAVDAVEAAGGAGAAQPVADQSAATNNDSAATPGRGGE